MSAMGNTYKEKSNGPRTDPCGTSVDNGFGSDLEPLRTTCLIIGVGIGSNSQVADDNSLMTLAKFIL